MIHISQDEYIDEQLKSYYSSDSIPKTLTIKFPNGEFPTITNDKIVAESLSFTESICSQDDFKFGLCEASSISFDCFDIGNIKDCVIDVTISAGNGADVSLGRFIVDSCDRSTDLLYRSVEAFSYTSKVYENGGLSGVERVKMETPVRGDDKYVINAVNFLYSNIPYVDTSKMSFTGVLPSTSTTERFTFDTTLSGYEASISVNSEYYMVGSDDNPRSHYHCFISNTSSAYPLLYIDTDDILGNTVGFHNAMAYFNKYGIVPVKNNVNVLLPHFVMVQDGITGGYDGRANIDRHVIDVGDDSLYNDNSSYALIYLPTSVDISITKAGFYESMSFNLQSHALLYGILRDSSNMTFSINDESLNMIFDRKETVKKKKKKNSYYSASYLANDMKAKNIIEGILELSGVFARQNRNTHKVEFIYLSNNFPLYPAYPLDYAHPFTTVQDGKTLYPDSNVFPMNGDFHYGMENIISAWYSDDIVKIYAGIKYSYKDAKDNDVEETIDLGSEIELDLELGELGRFIGSEYYDLSNNFVLKNIDPEVFEDADYLFTDILYSLARILPYSLAEIEARGLPYIEPGDYIHVDARDGNGFNTYVFRRTISGINSLMDSIESR